VPSLANAFIYDQRSLNSAQTIVRTWFNNNWSYRKSHVINGTGTTAGINYQIRIVVINGTGTDEGEIAYINNKARSDFGDIRFTTLKGTLLDYWQESMNAGINATFWVKIAENRTEQAQTIYLYYGNPSATTTSNGDKTFNFFDDFSGNLSKWNIHIGTDVSITSKYGDPAPCLEIRGGSTDWPFGFTVVGSNATYTGFQNGIIEADVYSSTDALPEIICRGNYSENTGYKGRWDSRSDE